MNGGAGMGLAVALSVGLMQGFLHCSGMCGPFVVAYAISLVPAKPTGAPAGSLGASGSGAGGSGGSGGSAGSAGSEALSGAALSTAAVSGVPGGSRALSVASGSAATSGAVSVASGSASTSSAATSAAAASGASTSGAAASALAAGAARAVRQRRWGTVRAHLCHNAGRIATFTLLGAAFGWIGSFVDAASRLTGLQAAAGLGGGALMIAWAVDQARTGHGGAGAERFSLLRVGPLQGLLQRSIGRRDPAGAFLAGGLLGFHPCGLLYTMLVIAAATGSPLQGALTMLAFGVGTVPALLSVAAAGTLGGARMRGRLFSYATAALVGASGILFALRGMAVNGWVPHLSPWLF